MRWSLYAYWQLLLSQSPCTVGREVEGVPPLILSMCVLMTMIVIREALELQKDTLIRKLVAEDQATKMVETIAQNYGRNDVFN
jgi:hypothetical protein